MASRQNRLLRRARDETTLRYGGELRGLASLMRQAKGERRHAVRSATGTAAGVTAATRAAMPQMRGVYGEAETAFGAANADVQQALGPGYEGSAAQREAAGAERRLAESRAGALSELTSRQVDAEAAKQYAIRQAEAQFKQDRGKIAGQARDLEEEMGQYLATTYRDLVDAERQYKQEQRRIQIAERDSRRLMRSTIADITGIDPRTGRPTAIQRDRMADNRLARQKERRIREEADKPPNTLSPDARRGYREQFQQAVSLLRSTKKWNPKKPNQTVDGLVGEKGIPREIAQAAFQHVTRGGVGPKLRKTVRSRFGFWVPKQPQQQEYGPDDLPPILEPLLG